MRAFALKKTRALLVLVVASAGVALVSAPASAAAVSFDLCAVTGTLNPLPTTAPAVSVPIWGFVQKGTALNCSDLDGTATVPGPQLVVNEGDTVTINVTNALPAGRTLRFEVPGVNFDPGFTDAADGATVSRTFTPLTGPTDTDATHTRPGTYLYQSGGDAGRQEAMGLYGALIVRSGTAGQAYDSATTAYDVEAPLVLSAIDPAFNAAPDTFVMHDYRATYWLINGKSYPDTAPGITATAGQRVLLRYVNGFDNTSMQLLGMHEHVVARDARLLNNPVDADAETIPAGGTEDAIATVPAGTPPSANGYALFNRQLHVTNGNAPTLTAPNPAYTPGGMLTFIHP